jgi:hypothetical protein
MSKVIWLILVEVAIDARSVNIGETVYVASHATCIGKASLVRKTGSATNAT